jgi:hypothetical protein
MVRGKRLLFGVVAAVAATTLAAGWGIAQAARSKSTRPAAATSSLASACGSTVVVQTDWFPEPEHAALYQLAGTKGTTDKAKGRYTGTIGKTGVKLEIRAGGPFTGFEQPIQQMYQDKSITLGYVNSDEAIRNSKNFPTVAIVTPLEFSPQILMWNPQKLKISKFPDIAKSNAKVLVFEGGVWVDYLIGKGWVKKGQVDTSYDGSPTKFVAADGDIVQQGFATSEPYLYEHDIKQYAKKVKYLLIRDSGYQPYPEPIAVRKADLNSKAACWKQLVPLIQRAQVAYMKNPTPVNNKLIEIDKTLAQFWQLTKGGNTYNTATQKKLGIVANGPNCTLGDFNLPRLQKTINQLKPIYKTQNVKTFNENLKSSAIASNRFINKSIGLKTGRCR